MIWKTKIHYTDTHTEYKTTPKLCIPIINCKTYNRKFKTPNGFISFYIKLTHCLTERLEQGSPFTTGLLFFSPLRHEEQTGELFVCFLLIEDEGKMRGLQTKRDRSTKSARAGN